MAISFKIDSQEGWDILLISGAIDEDAEVKFNEIKSSLNKNIIVDFNEVSMINSCGVRAWINFLREVENGKTVIFKNCTSEIISQINMIPSFLSTAQIESLFAEYTCEDCGHKSKQAFTKGKNMPSSPDDEIDEVTCEKCGSVMEMDELEDEFFAFLDAG